MLRAGFIGAGPRARSAHYPTLDQLDDVQLVAVAEWNAERRNAVADQYRIPHRFSDHREMLESMELDVVYCVMNEIYLLQPALDCLEAGLHLFIEKPPGKNPEEAQKILEAAERHDRVVAVGLQRRYAAVTQEAMRLVQERGPVSLAVGEFHKWIAHPGNTSTLWNDLIHAVDLIRYMVQSEPAEVSALGGRFGADWKNCYTALIGFENGAHGVLLGNRASGGRILRAELHGVGIGCYFVIPDQITVLRPKQRPETRSGPELAQADPRDVSRYDGVEPMHQDFLRAVQTGGHPISDLRDVIHTVSLVERIERASD